MRGILYLFCLASGACALVYEIAWIRLLSIDFGTTIYAVSTVLTVFMGGLALGSYVLGRWIDYPRPKTQVNRRVPLWPKTAEAVRTSIAKRPKPKDSADTDCCFLTKKGNRWVRTKGKKYPKEGEEDILISTNAISGCFRYLLRRLDINGRRGLGFYTLRHVFETIGGESKDQVAVNSIMGHVDSSMAGVYRESISDERLRAVTETVHAWLFPETVPPVDDLVASTASPTSLRNPTIVIEIEYDSSAGKRFSKRFEDSFQAKKFYTQKDVEGRNPVVTAEEM